MCTGHIDMHADMLQKSRQEAPKKKIEGQTSIKQTQVSPSHMDPSHSWVQSHSHLWFQRDLHHRTPPGWCRGLAWKQERQYFHCMSRRSTLSSTIRLFHQWQSRGYFLIDLCPNTMLCFRGNLLELSSSESQSNVLTQAGTQSHVFCLFPSHCPHWVVKCFSGAEWPRQHIKN